MDAKFLTILILNNEKKLKNNMIGFLSLFIKFEM